MKTETTAFETGAIFWHEQEDKAYFVRQVCVLLNETLQLSRYGTGMAHLLFVPIAVRPTNKIHEERIRYSKTKATLTMYLKMDYAAVAVATEEDMLRLLAALYLRGLGEAPWHRIPDFDGQRLCRDVAEVFARKGWVEVERGEA